MPIRTTTGDGGVAWHDPSMGDGIARYEHGPDASVRALADAWSRVGGARVIAVVEGVTDQIAVETTAGLVGVDLTEVVVLPINGAQAIARVAPELDRTAPGRPIVGLCDVAELPYFERAGAGRRFDVFVCRDDLEDELLRAAGEQLVLEVFDAGGDAASFRTMRRQAAWCDRPFAEQAHRFVRAGARRGQRYAEAVLRALPPERVPAPLRDLVAVVDRALRSP